MAETKLAIEAVRRGWRIGTHAVGDRAVRTLLDVYQAGTDIVRPFNPMTNVWGMVTRGTNSAGIQGPEHAIDVVTALRLGSIGAGRARRPGRLSRGPAGRRSGQPGRADPGVHHRGWPGHSGSRQAARAVTGPRPARQAN